MPPVVVPVAVVELDEAHAALGQPPRQQAVRARTSRRTPRAVQSRARCCGSLRDVDQPGHARLHAERHLVLRDAGARSRGRPPVAAALRVSASTASITSRCCARRHAGGVAQVEHGVALAAELHALEPARQEAAVPLPRRDRLRLRRRGPCEVSTTKPGRSSASRAEPVPDPRAHRRPAGDLRAGVHERVGRVVVDLLGLHRADDADSSAIAPMCGKSVADLLPGSPQRCEGMLRAEAAQLLPLELRDRLALGERLGHRLAVHRRRAPACGRTSRGATGRPPCRGR